MRSKIQLLVGSLVFLPLGTSVAQQPEEAFVLRAAALFLRDSLPKPIVVDAEMFRARPAIGSVSADDIAITMGAARGHLADVMQCSTTQGTKKDCVMRDRKTVLSFAQPVIRGDTAEADVYWIYQPEGKSPAVGATARLTLTRKGPRQWRVESMRHTGHS